jgi:type II secretory pathway pseudopilin PulG
MRAGKSEGQGAGDDLTRAVPRRAFTLIELLVILTIIAMILTMALPSIVGLIKSSRIGASTDILRAAVSYSRSSAISSDRSSTLDVANTETGEETERILVSVTVVADDFERYPVDLVALEELFEKEEYWSVEPSLSESGWLVVTDQTRELRAGAGTGDVQNAYAWNLNTEGVENPEIDDVSVAQARFRVVRPSPQGSAAEWGFGLLTNLERTTDVCNGYRLTVRGTLDEEGFNASSLVSLEKVYNPSNPTADRSLEAKNPLPDVMFSRTVDIVGETAILTPGIWYWLKLETKRRDGLVSIAGKFWICRADDEPSEWTLGPAYDAFPGARLPEGLMGDDNFEQEPLVGGCCGLWANGAEISADDFSVESQKSWALPAKVLLQAIEIDTDDMDLYYQNPDAHTLVLEPYMPGSFPLTYLPDGSAEQNMSVLVRITDTFSGNKRIVPIDNTGRVGGL